MTVLRSDPKICFNNYREDPYISLDKYFHNGVTVNSYRTAIQMCLEVLGTRLAPIPVVMSVTAAPSVVAAVLRSGAHPCLVDISEKTLQMDPLILKEVLEELKECIVLLSLPPGAS